ncbi:Sigma cross-reacting protein 27A [Klebsiella pneumoniae]|nr:Sigma cross-reacting protein 27A [Klebsiella pneumoniae]
MAAKIYGAGVQCTIGNDADTADSLKQMGAEHIDAPVDEIVEDSARKLVTTPAYMLAQSIAEAASGINKLVDRVLELVDQDKA